MLKRTTLFLSALSVLVATPLSAEVRRCDATYEWQTTGGSIGPIPFGKFTAKGGCGSKRVANRCRIRAREAAQRCIHTQWERRWSHHHANPNGNFDAEPPEACVADIEKYDLTTVCDKRKDNHDSKAICHFKVHPSNAEPLIVARRGDIKAALEAQVCCLYKEGKHQFQNDEKVHVRLSARTWSSGGHKQCRSNQDLSKDYKINCKKVRKNICH